MINGVYQWVAGVGSWSHTNEHIFRGSTAGRTSVAIKSICKHLCRIYYAFKKESRCVVVLEKEKDARGDKGEVYAYSNVSGKSAQDNQSLQIGILTPRRVRERK